MQSTQIPYKLPVLKQKRDALCHNLQSRLSKYWQSVLYAINFYDVKSTLAQVIKDQLVDLLTGVEIINMSVHITESQRSHCVCKIREIYTCWSLSLLLAQSSWTLVISYVIRALGASFVANIWSLTLVHNTSSSVPQNFPGEKKRIFRVTGISFVLMRWAPGQGLVNRKNKPGLETWSFTPTPHPPEMGEELEIELMIDPAYVRKPP